MTRAPHSRCRRLGLAAAVAACLALAAPAQEPAKADWDTVAGNLLLNLLVNGFIAAPAQPQRQALQIAVVGDDRFGRAVLALAGNKQLRGARPLPLATVAVAERELLQKQAQLLASDVVVFATDDERVHQQVIAAIGDRPILLCSRRAGFVAAGGHLQLWLSDDRRPRYELADKVLVARGFKLVPAVVSNSRKAPAGDR